MEKAETERAPEVREGCVKVSLPDEPRYASIPSGVSAASVRQSAAVQIAVFYHSFCTQPFLDVLLFII